MKHITNNKSTITGTFVDFPPHRGLNYQAMQKLPFLPGTFAPYNNS